MRIEDIMKRLPHRYPMFLVDKVLEIIPEKSIVAIKNVTINEHFFVGHFPNKPIMPGVLIIEAFAQTAALCSLNDKNINFDLSVNDLAYYLIGIDEARFRKPVIPGDQLRLEVNVESSNRSICKYSAKAIVDNTIVAEAKLIFAIRNLEN